MGGLTGRLGQDRRQAARQRFRGGVSGLELDRRPDARLVTGYVADRVPADLAYRKRYSG
jgi:hypothetical protein